MKITRNKLKITTGMLFFCLLLCNGCSQKQDVDLYENQENEASAVSYETEASKEIIIEAPSTASETIPTTREEYLPYGERYDFNIQPLSGFISQGIIYSGLNPWQDYKMTNCEVTVEEVTINGTAENEATGTGSSTQNASGGMKNLTIRLTAVMWEEYTKDGRKLSECMTPTLQLCDYYTGLIFPERDTKGTDRFETQAHLKYEDKEYEVNFSCEVAHSQGDWEAEPNGGYRRPAIFEIVYEVTAPKEYDGLMLCVTPVMEYYPPDTAGVEETERYMEESPEDEILLYKIETLGDEKTTIDKIENSEFKEETKEDRTQIQESKAEMP